ncbi:MAG: YeiH family putative sulfate export transporter [Cyanothece sp. SIO1E1]|nr:YeiH family putative sulfate export transporter [Cyanothece sp. SIO1E1]
MSSRLTNVDSQAHSRSQPKGYPLIAGLLLTAGVAFLATRLHNIPALSFLSPLILAVLLGMLIRNTVGTPPIFQPGIRFSLKRILKFAIILLGLQLSLSQLMEVGTGGLAIIAVTLISTFIFTCWVGKNLGISRELTQLIASGTSICGASAVVATNTVVEGSDEDVAYAVTIVSLFGTLSLLLYPLVATLLNLTPDVFGIWCGTSIHEVAQVVGAAFQRGQASGEMATIAKLSRVLFLVPILLTLGLVSTRSKHTSEKLKLNQLPIPWFVFGFIALLLLNSVNILPLDLKDWIIQANRFLLTIALAAMGLEISLHKMRQTGLKPLYLGAISWIFISVVGLSLVHTFH